MVRFNAACSSSLLLQSLIGFVPLDLDNFYPLFFIPHEIGKYLFLIVRVFESPVNGFGAHVF